MPYHQGLARVQGDPGFFGFIGKALKTVGGIVPGPIGAGLKGVGGILAPSKKPSVATPPFAAPLLPQQVTLGAGRAPRLLGPRGPVPVAEVMDDGTICPKKKRRRIDPLNVKALRRANTRQRAFLRTVDSTLKTMPTKGQVASRRKKIAGAK